MHADVVRAQRRGVSVVDPTGAAAERVARPNVRLELSSRVEALDAQRAPHLSDADARVPQYRVARKDLALARAPPHAALVAELGAAHAAHVVACGRLLDHVPALEAAHPPHLHAILEHRIRQLLDLVLICEAREPLVRARAAARAQLLLTLWAGDQPAVGGLSVECLTGVGHRHQPCPWPRRRSFRRLPHSPRCFRCLQRAPDLVEADKG
mmetsp:Transcript_9757/g.28994  ORF Transcript_9757/g.28994 Transcript_9757/m.28994 type:complete len:210 (+) Transcript_9757:636-1265(+)